MKNHFKRWTQRDVDFLIENNGLYTAVELASILNRSPESIESKRMRLKIKANPEIKSKKISESKREANNPNWKGNDVPVDRGRERARNKFKQTKPCEVCGKQRTERHHKDGDTLNNNIEDIQFLCRKHHMEADKRLSNLVERNKKGKNGDSRNCLSCNKTFYVVRSKAKKRKYCSRKCYFKHKKEAV